jgi:serine phosphatase RsbU (regulator of sigma subunit)
MSPDPPLGCGWVGRRSSTVLTTTAGTVAAFYTDGLVERRGEPINVGLDRLCAALSPAHPYVVTGDLMHQLVGTTVAHDDIALVVLRRTPSALI